MTAPRRGRMFGVASSLAGGGGMSVGGAVTGATSGGLLFTDASNQLAQDPTVLFWDDTNNRLGIGNAAPATTLHVTGTVRATVGLTLDFLTAGRIPFAGASGALTDDADLTFATDTLTATKIVTTALTDSGLTSGRIPFAGTGGLLGDAATLTFSAGTLSATALQATGLTSGRVPIVGASGLLGDDADMTFATDTLTVTKLSTTNFLSATSQSFTLNSVLSATLGVAAASVPDADVVFGVGRFLCDSRTTDTVNLSHRDNTGTTSWAIQFGATGFVGVNALTGSSGALRANNVTKFAWSTAGLSFFNATIAAQQNITGSRGGNAALADLLTKLATIGLITDGTSA